MLRLQAGNYQLLFQNKSFRAYWLGFTLSILGDAITRVALTWFVYERTNSAAALGFLTLAYTGPVLLGGFLAGPLLDRFDKRKVMIVDNLLRGTAVALIPLLNALDRLEIGVIYIVAAVYGLLMMISLAGSPALIPALVSKERLDTANALETLSFTLSGVIGPPLAGFLIAGIGAPNVVLVDMASFFLFALALWHIRLSSDGAIPTVKAETRHRISDAVQLLVNNPVLLSTTLMFMAFNLGFGLLTVWLPIYSDQFLGGGAELYGVLLGFLAAGEVASSLLAGGLALPIPLGALIALAQLLSGLSLGILLLGPNLWWVIPGLILLGFFSAPLTIWAQTLRMQLIPEPLRGRMFALLRTLMQGAMPVGGAFGGLMLPALGIPVMIGLSAVLIGAPGLVGYQLSELRSAGSSSQESL